MRSFTLFLTLAFLFFPNFSLCASWLNTGFLLESAASVDKNLPGNLAYPDYKTSTTNLFVSVNIRPLANLQADTLFHASYSYISYDSISEDDTDFNIYKFSAIYKNSLFYVNAGRQFFGQKNTLLPYYGVYDNFNLPAASSIDGVTAGFTPARWLEFSVMAAEETKDDKADIAGAEVKFTPVSFLEITPFFFSKEYKDESIWLDKKLQMYGLYGNLDLGFGTLLHLSYAQNGGETKNTLLRSKKPDEYKGHAFLAKLNTENVGRAGFYKVRFLYARSSGYAKGKDYSHFEGIHPYIYMGSIFTGSNLPNSFQHTMNITDFTNGGIDNLTAYNFGATFIPKFADFIALDFDIFAIAQSANPVADTDIGSEMDIALTITPFKNFNITLGYARFSPGNALKQMNIASKDVEQYSGKISFKF
ncbi:hypothetical protein Dip510_000748 [Elusimicrobium posterum]|uniref:hypothetical protein n=1 Tax=Elusimicrobium posterum TaxID=3116653 RepID=UPI003C734BA4